MKKISILLCLMTVLFCGCGNNSVSVKESNANDSEITLEMKESSSESSQNSNTERVLTISAVGDCTLANDINASKSACFDTKAKEVGDYSYFLKDAKPYFENDDLTIVNFEGTLSENGQRQNKQFAFRGKPEYVKILTSSSVEAANFANNHNKDYGQVSYDDTINTLESAGIAVFVGDKVQTLDINGVKVGLVGIYALTEEGQKYLEPAMEKVKESNPDVIIVSFHWGVEKATAPNATQKQLAHKAVDLGANLVIGHHPHVLQGIEKYNGSYILYSLGNFCFGGNTNMSDKDTAMFRQSFTVGPDGKVLDNDAVEIIPFLASSVNNANDYHPTPATGEKRDKIINKLTKYSNALGSDAVLSFGE